MNIDSYEKLLAELDGNSGIMTVEMGRLRDIHGVGKLGVHVIKGIVQSLESKGIGHYPSNLPVNQWGQVRIYKKGTIVGKMIEAVNKVGEDEDEYIRTNLNSEDQNVLQKVRELVCG